MESPVNSLLADIFINLKKLYIKFNNWKILYTLWNGYMDDTMFERGMHQGRQITFKIISRISIQKLLLDWKKITFQKKIFKFNNYTHQYPFYLYNYLQTYIYSNYYF